MYNPIQKYINKNKVDAVVYKAEKLYKDAGEDVHRQSDAVREISEMLICIESEILFDSYISLISKYAGVKAVLLTKGTKALKDKESAQKSEQYLAERAKAVPKWINMDRLETLGFDWKIDTGSPENTGMYFRKAGGHIEQMTNFVITPIIQIKSFVDEDKRRITEIFNGKTKHVFELPSKAFISPELFESTLMDEGYYVCYDGFAKSHINRIKTHFVGQFPEGSELKKLGWQPEGFFAFSNIIYNGGLVKFDEYGLAKVNDKMYLSMGASNILAGIRSDEDIYKNDKALRYVESPISFTEWAKLMLDVYQDKGMMGIAYCMLAANRDIVMTRNNYCPLPYVYGAAGSGKSQFMDSCVSVFAVGLRAFNLNQGTEFAFWEYMERFRNILAPYNEFDVQSIEEKRSRAFKGAADGEGRTKGSGRRNKTTTQEINSTPMLGGQYLAAMDGSSILSRAIPEKFTVIIDRSEEQKANFFKLKDLEKKGITSLSTQFFHQRQFIEENYQDTYDETRKRLNKEFKEEGLAPQDRAMENYTTIATLVNLYSQKLTLPFTSDDFYQYCKLQIIKLNTMVGESNNLGEFWKILEFLANTEKGIEPGWEYKIEVHTEVKSMIADKDSKNAYTFDKPTRLLFLRFNLCHSAFAGEYKRQKGKSAVSDGTIRTYLTDQPYYIGAQSNGNFKSKRQNTKAGTSSMVINYDILVATNDINLERIDPEDVRELAILDGVVQQDATMVDILGVVKMQFTLWQDESYVLDGVTISKNIFTKCLSEAHTGMLFKLKRDVKVRVTGMLATSTRKDTIYRSMEIQNIELIVPQPGFTPTPPPQQFEIDQDQTDESTI